MRLLYLFLCIFGVANAGFLDVIGDGLNAIKDGFLKGAQAVGQFIADNMPITKNEAQLAQDRAFAQIRNGSTRAWMISIYDDAIDWINEKRVNYNNGFRARSCQKLSLIHYKENHTFIDMWPEWAYQVVFDCDDWLNWNNGLIKTTTGRPTTEAEPTAATMIGVYDDVVDG